MSDQLPPLKPGQKLKDNDPRMPNRELVIVGVSEKYVRVRDSRGRMFMILRRRIHTDGKKRRGGFDVVL